MTSRDERLQDWWFHRDRQLDWKDQLARTERELETLRLRHSSPSRADGAAREPAERDLEADRQRLAVGIVAAHQEVIERLRELNIGLHRDLVDQWLALLLEIEPLQPGSHRQVEALAKEIEEFLGRTTEWELGRGSLGSGMVIRDGLALIRSCLATMAIDMRLR